MSVTSFIRRALRGQEALRHQAETESEILFQKGRVAQHQQAMESGSRVMENMAGMMKLMSMAGQCDDRHR